MKKILFFILAVVMLCACNYAPKKITGLVQKFEPDGKPDIFLSSGPIITFSDGRTVCLKNMPEKTIEAGSEIIIWYTGENAAFVFNDSITILKQAPVTPQPLSEDVTDLPLSPNDFNLLANLVKTKGVSVTESDCQYVYLDKLGNRHTMIAIRRNGDSADSKAAISQISVWVSNKNKPECDILFSYVIKLGGIEFASDADPQVIKTAIHSLLVMAGK